MYRAPDESQRCVDENRIAHMKTERQVVEGEMKELRDQFVPRRGRFNLSEERKRGRVKHTDSSPLFAVRTLGSGMHAGLTSPSRPWQKSTIEDKDLAKWQPVERWLSLVDERMMALYQRAGVYAALPFMYPEFGAIGTMCGLMLNDPRSLFRVEAYTVGQYYLAKSDTGEYDTMARELQMTVRQLVSRFAQLPDGKLDMSRISDRVRRMWEHQKQRENMVEIWHIVQPDGRGAWSSTWYESGESRQPPLKVARFNKNPILAAAWESIGIEPYAVNCPGMVAVGDAMALQIDDRTKSQAIERADNPPMQGPVKAVNLRPGSYTQVDDTALQKGGIRSVYDFRPDIQWRLANIQARTNRINSAFFADLFLMLTMDERAQRATAEEIRARYDEKVLALGPTLEQANSMLRQLHSFAFDAMLQQSMPIWRGVLDGEPMLPEPPEELMRDGAEIEPEFISALQQAQRSAALQPMERFATAVGSIAQLTQKLPDKFDSDIWLERYAEAVGVDPGVVRDDEEVAAIREQEAQTQRMQQMAAMAPAAGQMAGAMRDAAEAVPQEGSVLSALTGAMQAGAPQ